MIDINRLPQWAQRLVALSQRVSGRMRPHLDRSFSRWIPEQQDAALDWASDADRARIEQEPLRARALLRWIAGISGVLLLWSAFASLDEVTRGDGKVVPSSQLQIIQSVDGGVVEEILTKEGDTVEAGQPLMRIDTTRFESNLQESRAQYLSLLIKTARLTALSTGKPFVVPEEVQKEAPELVAAEQTLYDSSQAELDTQVSIARDQLSQRHHELREMQARRDQASRGYELSARELSMTRPLAASGAVSDVEILRLERETSRLAGDRDQASAQIGRLQSAIAESARKIEEAELNMRNRWRNELAESQSKVGSLSEGGRALADRVDKAVIKSPMRGTVKRLLVTTVGGVVQPGKEVVEVVPLDDALVLEAQIKPKDIAFLRPGQKATVKFTAYDFSVYGGLEAVVDHIRADTVTDDKGNSYYVIRLHTLKSKLGDKLPIIPGMVAEVDILTGKKTVLSYLLKPVLRAKQQALTEK